MGPLIAIVITVLAIIGCAALFINAGNKKPDELPTKNLQILTIILLFILIVIGLMLLFGVQFNFSEEQLVN
ncbi:MAG: hypothetical protein RR577_04365 [Erysipelotrichales bacterium]